MSLLDVESVGRGIYGGRGDENRLQNEKKNPSKMPSMTRSDDEEEPLFSLGGEGRQEIKSERAIRARDLVEYKSAQTSRTLILTVSAMSSLLVRR